MSNLSQNNLFKIPILLFGLGVFLVMAFIFWGKNRRDVGIKEWDSLERRLQFSQSSAIAPSAAILQSLQEANNQLLKTNTKLDAILFAAGRSPISEFTGNSTASYFELAGFVEEHSELLAKSGVVLPDGIRFGFSQFEQQGPEDETLVAVMAQKETAEIILEPLQLARPVALVSFRREFLEPVLKSPTVLQQAAGARTSRRTRPADTIESGIKTAGLESFTFELVFEGYTESLRRYLKALLAAPLPVVVTNFEVSPLDRYGSTETARASGSSVNPFDLISDEREPEREDGPVPIIRNNLSSFRLELEVYTGGEAVSDV